MASTEVGGLMITETWLVGMIAGCSMATVIPGAESIAN